MRRITRRAKPDEERKIETLVSSKRDGDTVLRSIAIQSTEKRREPTVSKTQLENLYRYDSLTFRIVQKYVEKMFGSGFTIKGGTDEVIELCQKFCDDIDISYVMGEAIKDIFVLGNGNGWVELGYTKNGRDITKVKIINPKSGVDYLRNTQTQDIIYELDLKAKGFKLGGEFGYPKMTWTKNAIYKGDQKVWTPKTPTDDGRDRVAHFKLIGVGEEELGMSPLEPSYKSAIIRLNLEDTVGNSAFRSSALAAYVGYEGQNPEEITDDQLDGVTDKLLKVDQDTVWSFRRNVEITQFPAPVVQNFERLMYYFADMQTSGTGIGISLILQPLDRGYRGDISIAQEEFMDSVKLFQDRIQFQVREQFFKRLLKARGIEEGLAPFIMFRSRESGIALSTSRRLATYARYELITPDPALEDWIREREGLPPKDRSISEIPEEEESEEPEEVEKPKEEEDPKEE